MTPPPRSMYTIVPVHVVCPPTGLEVVVPRPWREGALSSRPSTWKGGCGGNSPTVAEKLCVVVAVVAVVEVEVEVWREHSTVASCSKALAPSSTMRGIRSR